MSSVTSRIRDVTAIIVTGLFVFPLLWWGLTSIKPADAILQSDPVVLLDFVPTFANYDVTLLGTGPQSFDSRPALISSFLVSVMATMITLATALPMAQGLTILTNRWRKTALAALLMQRFVPPIALIIPLVLGFDAVELYDSRVAVACAHATLNLPFAVLLLHSFLSDIPAEVSEAAALDGATPLQIFLRIKLPLVRGGIAATAILAFIFSWTEFLLSLFLTSNIRMIPVQASILVNQLFGYTSALSTTALLPCFIFILLVQRHLVRGLTMGLQR